MADNKKYYYMRLKENFFETDEMIFLESMEEGFLFSNILLKLYLRSLKNEGLLMMNEVVPYDARMISRFTNHSLSTVEKALFEFKKLGLIEVLDSGQMYMSNIELFVGKTTTEADRKRLGRKKVEQKLLEGTNVGQMSEKSPPEKELELELELEKEKHIVVAKAPTVASKNVMPVEMMEMIIDYLNNKFEKKKNYRLSDTYKKLFNALYKAGHRDIGEYQYVIDNKYSEWIGTDMQTYIRPATLFAKEKFEKYIDEEPFVAYSNNKHQQQLKPWEVEAYNEPTTSWNDNVNDRGSISKPVPHKQLGINF